MSELGPFFQSCEADNFLVVLFMSATIVDGYTTREMSIEIPVQIDMKVDCRLCAVI